MPLDAHYLYRCFTGSWAVQFNEEHPLVCAKLELATYDRGDQFDHAAAAGFISIYGLPVRTQNQTQRE